MALGLDKKSAEALGIRLLDIEHIEKLAPVNYYDWQENRNIIQLNHLI